MAETKITPNCIWGGRISFQTTNQLDGLITGSTSQLTIVHDSAIAFPLSFSAGRPTNRLPYLAQIIT